MNKPPPEILLHDLRETVCVICENLLYQKELLEQVMVVLEQLESDQRLSPSNAAASTAAWQPPEDGAAMAGRLAMIKVRKVEPHSDTPDIVTRLKGRWIGRFYLEYLKQISLIRKIVIAIWRNFYPVYARYIVARFSLVARRWCLIVKMADYVEESNIPLIKVFDAAKVDTLTPKVVPAEDQTYLVSPHNYYEFPPIYVAQLSDAQVYGGTNLVFVKDAVICHDLYDFESDYTSEELHGHHVIDAKKKRMYLVRNDATPEHMPVAAAFLDACAPNYAHWLTETLPRIAVFCSVEQYANVPIIVNDGLHRNIIESLAWIVGPDRECILLPVGRAIRIDRLYLTSVAGYVPFEPRKRGSRRQRRGEFSPHALSSQRDRMKGFCWSDVTIWPQRIYLRRNSHARQLTNATELLDLLVSRGFSVVDPEKLTFIQQVQLFMNAKVVVGATGAAIANTVFCPRGSQVGILLAKNERLAYEYWVNMLTPMDINVTYILGKGSNSNEHSDFTIDQAHLMEFLDALNEDKL